MNNAIEVRFVVGGVQEIDRAFRSVEQAATRLEKSTQRSYDNDARAAARAAREKEREIVRGEREQTRIRETGYRENARIAAGEAKAADVAVKEKIRSEERWARQRAQIQEYSAKLAYRIAEQEVRAVEQAEREKQRIRERHARAIGTGAVRSVGGLTRGATNLAGMALSLGGGLAIGDAMHKEFSLERTASLFSNQTSSTGKRVSNKEIIAQARAIGIATNTDPTQVAEAMNAYFAKASDAQGAMKNARLFAELSKATGSDIGQIATTAGALRVQNPNLDDKAMREMLLGIVGQTRLGAVDIVDLAQHVPTITATSALYGGDQALNQRKLIGLSQVAMRTSGSSADAATAVQRFGSDIASNADKIHALTGFSVKDKSGMLKDPAAAMAALMQASGGDIGKLKHMGIGRESIRLFEAEEQTFHGAGGGKAGAAAVAADIAKFTNGGYTEEGLKSDLANTMNTTGERFGKAVTKVETALEEHLTPWLEKLADKLPDMIPKIESVIDEIDKLAGWAANNPIEAVVGALALAVGKGAVTQAVADSLRKVITSSLTGGGGTPTPVPGAGGGSSSTNQLATGVGATAALVGGEHLLSSADRALDAHNRGRNVAASAHDYLASLRGGNAGWLFGAKWNPLIMGAELATGYASDEGKIEVGKKYKGKTTDQIEAEAKQRHDELKKNTDALAKHTAAIDRLVATLGSGGATSAHPGSPARNASMSDPSRGGTK